MPTKPLRYCTYPGCRRRVPGGRCDEHETARDRDRGSRQQRGYGAEHQRARAALIAVLPAPCMYCGRTIHTAGELVAAHIEDGNPAAGYGPAHAPCNERNKRH